MAVAASKRRDRQVVRILGILGTLLEGGQPSICQLAARYGTRRETIYRDIRALEDVGYPIAGDDNGRLSHPRLLPEARRHAPQLRFADSEINALLWASRQAGAKSPFRDALSSAKVKLRAMASAKDAAAAAGIDAAVIDDGYGVKDYAPHRETLMKLVEAIVRKKQCEVEYQSPEALTAKRYQYEPYRLLAVGGGLYCVGKIPTYRDVTTLAVDRIRALTVLTSAFEIDPDFDPDRYRRESFGIIWEEPMDVTIRFAADQAPYVREREWHPTQTIRDLPDGSIELSFRAGGMFEIVRWVLGWGESAEVIHPPALREKVREQLAAALEKY